ncbi:MAG: hypothetical protein HY435_02600 [Candidatus Liptonbacteria bacterium]|nr:hypothetical protein [Candidatus Liptonbacteria bacterium]
MKGILFKTEVLMQGKKRVEIQHVCCERVVHLRIAGKIWDVSDCDRSCEQYEVTIPPVAEPAVRSAIRRRRGLPPMRASDPIRTTRGASAAE